MRCSGEATAVNDARWPVEHHDLDKLNAQIARCREEHPDDLAECVPLRSGYAPNGIAFNIWTDSHRSAARIALFHYVTKSRQDFQVKMDRGSAKTGRATGYRSWEEFDMWDRCALLHCCLALW